MRITRLLPVCAAFLTFAPIVASAQQSGSEANARPTALASAVPNPRAAAPLAAMRARLRDLVTAQEGYWMGHGTYTTDLVALGVFERGRARADSTFVQVIFAGGRGWTGVATHRALQGKSCVVYIGLPDELPKLPTTMADRAAPGSEGEVVCDAP
jgi:hypothetical protein